MSSVIKKTSRGTLVAASVVGVILLALVICEALGWPFLAAPLQRWVGQTLQRPVSFSEDPNAHPKVTIHLFGGVDVRAAYIMIGAPTWSQAPHMLLARDAHMVLGYGDLWRASRGEPLRIRELRAAQLDGQIERLADGRASWQFGKSADTPDPDKKPTRMPKFDRLQVDAGAVMYRDAMTVVELNSTFALIDGSAAPVNGSSTGTFQLQGQGTYRKMPMKVDLKTDGVLPVIADGAKTLAIPVRLEAHAGGSRMSFVGTATDALHFTALKGRFDVQGPSLAAVGDPIGVTLPTTGPFHAQGLVAKDGVVWNSVFEHVSIGTSRLSGAFTYDPRSRLPMLAGRLSGSKLALADLGPAVGAPVPKGAASAPPPAAAATPANNGKRGRVLPSRDFDLPALRAMDANVLVDVANVDLGSSFLEPLVPFRTHIVLANGVLTLSDIDARTGQGQLGGNVQLDGRNAQALWTANLNWAGVRLESWIHQTRSNGAPPYATGNLAGQARVAGQGKSTAAILGSLRGGVRMQLSDGTVSHLAVEAAGLDIAQGLGMLFKGDDSLPVECGVADLVADQGVLKPRVLVLDTGDSTLWVDGSLSLASEAMDLRLIVTPKDFSPMALRTPLKIGGTFGDPTFSLEKGPLGTRLGAAALLALVNPFAALIPLIDTGSSADAKRGDAQCKALSARIAAHPTLAAPPPVKPAAQRKTAVG